MFGRDRLSSDVSEIKLRRLATLILLLALGGCAQVATGQDRRRPFLIRTIAGRIFAACSGQETEGTNNGRGFCCRA